MRLCIDSIGQNWKLKLEIFCKADERWQPLNFQQGRVCEILVIRKIGIPLGCAKSKIGQCEIAKVLALQHFTVQCR